MTPTFVGRRLKQRQQRYFGVKASTEEKDERIRCINLPWLCIILFWVERSRFHVPLRLIKATIQLHVIIADFCETFCSCWLSIKT